MATDNVPLPQGVWTEVTGPRGMADGEEYACEVVGGPAEAVDVTGNAAPAAEAVGHPYYPGTRSRQADYRSFTKKAGQTWWFRAAGADTKFVASEL